MQPDRPLVTIVTPVYNAGRHIERCIASVLAQTYPAWEQVVVDDGSSDDTAERAAGFADPRLRIVRLPHRGLAALAETYNAALAASHGSLVAILEGDDYWPADKLARQVPVFDDPTVVLSWGDGIVVNENDQPLHVFPRSRLAASELSMPELFHRLTRANFIAPSVTALVRRRALDAIGGFQQRAGGPYVDLPTWLCLAARVPGRALMLDGNLGYYRRHAAQTTQQRDFDMRFAHYDIVQQILAELDAGALANLGWDARHQQAALASAEVTRGIGCLRSHRRAEARSRFASALRQTRSKRELVRATLGYISTIIPVDLVAVADNTRVALKVPK